MRVASSGARWGRLGGAGTGARLLVARLASNPFLRSQETSS